MKVVLLGAGNLVNQRHLNNDPINSILHGLLIENGIECISIYNLLVEDAIKQIEQIQPDYVGVNINFPLDFEFLSESLKKIKNRAKKCKLIGYGVYISVCTEYIVHKSQYNEFDIVITGQPEMAFVNVVTNKDYHAIEKEGILVVDGVEIEDINHLPLAYNPYKNEVSLRIAWGCKFNCLFCEERSISKEYKYRTVDNVVMELKKIYEAREKSKELWIMFSDLDFLAITSSDVAWIPEFVEQVKANKLNFKFSIQTRANWINEEIIVLLKSIGLNSVGIGIESGSKRVLDLYNKGIQDIDCNINAIQILIKHQISYKMNFIMYEPTTSMEDIKDNIKYLYRCGYPKGVTPSQPPASFFDRVVLFPYSDAYRLYQEKENVHLWIDKERVKYDFKNGDVRIFYQHVRTWRKKVRFLNQVYFFLLNQTYELNEYIDTEKKRKEILMRLMMLKYRFLQIDLQFLDELAQADFNDKNKLSEIIESHYKKAKFTENKLVKLKDEYFGASSDIVICNNTLKTRGYHRQMHEILTEK